MTNEVYKIMCSLYHACELGLGSGLLYILMPSTKGKSDRVQIFMRDHPKSKLLPAGTNAALYEIIYRAVSNNDIKMFFIDDRTLWVRNDFNDAIAYLKILSEGKVKHLRKTKFAMEEVEIKAMTVGVLLLNYIQGDSAFPRLCETGFIDRALKLKVTHTDKEYKRIMNEYAANGWAAEKTLPKIYIPPGFFKPGVVEGDKTRTYDIDPCVQMWIADNFKSATRKTVELLARVTTVNGFESLKPILNASLQDMPFDEYAEFESEPKYNEVKEAIVNVNPA